MIDLVEPGSPTWRALRKHIDARIAELQVHLEAPSAPDFTAMLRGQIMELRLLIAAVEPPEVLQRAPATESTTPLYG